MKERWYDLYDAAYYLGIGRGAVYLALQKGKFPNSKINEKKKWIIPRTDLDVYEKGKYSREKFLDRSRGEMSTREAAEALGMPVQIIYYFLREGLLKSERKHWHYVVQREHLEEFKRKRGME
jgi:Helix-turn-helix domain